MKVSNKKDHLLNNHPKSTVSKNCKNSTVGEGEGSTSCSKKREGQKEIRKFCSINCEFSTFCVAFWNNDAMFVGFSLIYLQSSFKN